MVEAFKTVRTCHAVSFLSLSTDSFYGTHKFISHHSRWKMITYYYNSEVIALCTAKCKSDHILENLLFWHIGQSDGNHPYLLGKCFGVKPQQEGLIVALSKCAKKIVKIFN